ncbi:MAG: DUF4242 domain-containing protein [Verrucomicrobiales bacterium]|nr:DUF4242 domain-containing protein [Verrucomicrobiales bacterium]
MPKFVIERTLPNAGNLSANQLRDISALSNRVLRDLGPEIQWIQTYITDNKCYCVYIAPDAGLIREHAMRGSLPIDSVLEIRTVIDPTTAE